MKRIITLFFIFSITVFAFGQSNSNTSSQQEINNFPVSITEVSFETLPTSGNQLLNGKLNIDVIFNLSSEIGGRSSLGVLASIEDQSNNGGNKFSPQFNGVMIDSINIQANLAAVSIDGTIGFRNNDPVFGNGFIGTLSANFKTGITTNALAEFGNTNYQYSSLYRYWRVQAEATFPAPGIAFLPGMAFRGFGGGAYNNMDASLNSLGTSYEFTPYKSNFGFIAQTILATTPKEESFNADCDLLAQFSSSNGITNIGFLGDFYIGASLMPSSRAKAKIIGNVGVTYDFPLKHFNLSANVDVNAPPITTPYPANLVLDINGLTNKWYFKFGEPSHLNMVNVMNISSYEYLTFGNDITPPSGFTSNFSDDYYNLLGSHPSASSIGSGGVGSNTATGSAFALGVGFTFDSDGDIVLTKYSNNNTKHSFFYDLAGGAELHLSYAEYVGSCGGYNPMGINGWRAKGGLGMYCGTVSNIRKYKRSGSIQWDMQVADIRAGAWISGEFPKPSYVAGAIDGVVNLLDLVNFNFHLEFEDGTSCNNSGAVSNVVVTQEDAAADQQNLLIQYVNPIQSWNFSTESPLVVKYGLVPDDVFDVAEQQSDGTIENRTFKLEVTKSLEMEDPNTTVFNNIPLNTDENNLGEFLYTTSQQTTTGNMQGSSMAGQNISLGDSRTSLSSQLDPVTTQTTLSNFTINFPPSNTNNYSNLPPEPEPVINHLTEDMDYKFTVTATLKEYVNSNWVDALKSDGSDVTQTVVKNFSTGEIQLVNSGSSIQQND